MKFTVCVSKFRTFTCRRTVQSVARGLSSGRRGLPTVLCGIVLIVVHSLRAARIPKFVLSREEIEFMQYLPSEFEQSWYEKRYTYQSDPSKICDDMRAYEEELKAWIAYTKDPTEATASERIFSKMLFRINQTHRQVRLIEPLVGHFRHPFALSHCKPSKAQTVGIQDRSYIAYAGKERLDNALFPGNRFLFDLGTADYTTSLGFMISKYNDYDIQFDRIWAWEARPKPGYWEVVPENVHGILHFYNYPITSNITALSHPLQILRQNHKDGDYVVLKLDIDNSNLELSIMEEIKRDPQLRRMISEMMFEMHYDSPDMEKYFGRSNNMSYVKTLETLREFREIGLFLHYWP